MDECLYKRFKCFMNYNAFLCIYLGEGKGCVMVADLCHFVFSLYRGDITKAP